MTIHIDPKMLVQPTFAAYPNFGWVVITQNGFFHGFVCTIVHRESLANYVDVEDYWVSPGNYLQLLDFHIFIGVQGYPSRQTDLTAACISLDPCRNRPSDCGCVSLVEFGFHRESQRNHEESISSNDDMIQLPHTLSCIHVIHCILM